MRLPIQVEGIVFRRTDNGIEYLLLKRTPERGDFWQAVTGGYEDTDPSLKEALLRELEEEVCISQDQVTNMIEDVYFFQFPDHNDVMLTEYVFGCEVSSDVVINIEHNVTPEHTEFAWVSFDKALALLTWDTNKTALSKLNELLTK